MENEAPPLLHSAISDTHPIMAYIDQPSLEDLPGSEMTYLK